MDTALPVWTIRPNWKDGIVEHLEWLTDVIATDTGVEQRRSVRLSPRRSFEITVNPTNQERTYLDLLLHALGSEEWYFPLWHDKAKLTTATTIGAVDLIFDNTYREFNTGGFAILYKDAFTYEVVEITGQTDSGLGVSALETAWPKNTSVYPIRVATVDQQTQLKALTSRVGESVLLFTVNEANDWPELAPGDLVYGGVPVIAKEPNRVSEITSDHSRIVYEADGQIGLRERVDGVGRAFTVQSHNWIVQGRQAQSEFRSMLYWLRGRQRSVWLPTFNDDVTVSRAAALAATNLDIKKIGMGYVGGGLVVPGRDHLFINGDCLQITAMGAPMSDSEERLRVSALPHALPVGKNGSFMDSARLDQDAIEIQHHADSDGTMEVTAAFHTFKNTRDPSGVTYLPIPTGEMSPENCGSPESDNPCSVIFPGWYWRVVIEIGMEGGHEYNPDPLLTINGGSPLHASAVFLGWRTEYQFHSPSIDPIEGSYGETIELARDYRDGATITNGYIPPDDGRNFPLVSVFIERWDDVGSPTNLLPGDAWIGGGFPFGFTWTYP